MGSDPVELDFAMPINELSEVEELRRELREALEARTSELSEALQEQRATAEILHVMSNSPSNAQPVFDAILESAVRLCEAQFALAYRLEGEMVHLVGHHNFPLETLEQFRRSFPQRLSESGTLVAQAMLRGEVVVVDDIHCHSQVSESVRGLARSAGYRSVIAVPMLKSGRALGAIALTRSDEKGGPYPFSHERIELLRTFASQAVIAIENVRLFEKVQARTRDLTRSVTELKALGETGRAISSSLDLDRVLLTILEHACEISETGGGAIYVFDEARSEFVYAAGRNMGTELMTAVRKHPIRLGEALIGICGARREAVSIEDLTKAAPHPLFELHLKAGTRALLAVPLLHLNKLIGALVVRRRRPGAFARETAALLEAFAAQSAIAIHNARLFKEIEEKSRELEIASQHKSQFVANMSHELRTPLAAILGYAELMQEGFYEPLGRKSIDALTRIRSNGKHLLGLINSLLDIAKIESGQFSLNLAEYALESVVETVRAATESLTQTKKLELQAVVGKNLPVGLGDEQRLTQVLLNLVGNAIKFTDAGQVRIVATTANGHFAVSVTDTGPGIPDEQQAHIFEQFHQVDSSLTRAKGGTGLGLAIAKQIVEMHSGRIWVVSTVGQGATFHMELPIRAEFRKAAE